MSDLARAEHAVRPIGPTARTHPPGGAAGSASAHLHSGADLPQADTFRRGEGCSVHAQLSIVHGPALDSEAPLGVLTLPGFLQQSFERFGSREALIGRSDGGGENRWTYESVWTAARRVATALLRGGVGKGQRVGVLMTNRPEWVIAVFGIAMCGGVAVPLSTFSTPAELEHLLNASAVSILLFEARVAKKDFAQILRQLEPYVDADAPGRLMSLKLPFLRRLVALEDDAAGGVIESWECFLRQGELVPVEIVEAAAALVQPSDPGLLCFSSGSTARPKGVLNSHRGVVLQCWRQAKLLGLHGEVRAWTPNGLFWSGNFAMVLGATMSAGGAVVLQRIFDPAEALRLIEDERVTFAHAWPHQWAEIEAAPTWAEADLSSLHFVDSSKAVARHPTVSTSWVEPRWCYGSTETFTISTGFPANTPHEVARESHGLPLAGNTIRIVDPLSGAVAPLGERGEIAVKGPTLMLGYLGVPLDETLDDEGFFRTGDGGYLDADGRLFWEGRLNDIIKTGGANVSPLEIDEALSTYPDVKVGKTVGVPHETLGEMVVSCVVPHEGRDIDESLLRSYLRDRLASYKVPRRILILSDADIAITGSSKIKTAELRTLASQRLRDAEAGEPRRGAGAADVLSKRS